MLTELFPDINTRTHVMGIVNLTEDSFSGDGLMNAGSPVDAALAQAQRFAEEGADVLDLGAESTRPGAKPLAAHEEIARLVPVVEALREALPEMPLSIDTYKAETAQACLRAGAQIINDIWGLRKDPEMARVAAEAKAGIILMHNRRGEKTQQTALGGRYVDVDDADVVLSVREGLQVSLALAKAAGIADGDIWLDPGIGFGKTSDQNLVLLRGLDRLTDMGYPVLLGISRKSFIGYTLNLPMEERLEGSLAANAWGVTQGVKVLRVHDVRATVRLARMLDAIRLA